MSSYCVANYNVTNTDGYEAYIAAVVPTIVSHGGKILVAGPNSTAMEGNPGSVTIVLQFPGREALEGWFKSPEYQEIIHLRTDNTDGFVVFADEFVIPS